MIMDIYSRKIISAEIFNAESAEHAAPLFKLAVEQEKVDPNEIHQVHIHADNGTVMKSSTLLATFQNLGLIPSYSRPSVSDDNPFSESLFRTVKYCPLYPTKPFESLLVPQEWLKKFIHWYNTIHRHSGIGFVTPEQRHNHQSEAIFKARTAVYEAAKQARPSRWYGGIRKWESSQEVVLKHTRTPRSAAA
jgi:transposase InsO family protein